ncbi:hypothetical protein DSO57_1032912 [Entomophthora muscae]|uniref:Uncharacterized protein n=1 Tax=Entomophthora muscae TaxID=34485 RepID=A0ACC2T055_9FUNG|nr:hypothetical protein DSO57_1032912 [Entomophthora muscae]
MLHKDPGLNPLGGFVTEFSHRSSQDKKKAKATAVTSASKEVSLNTLKAKKAWDLAFASAKSIPMNAIMIYMSGNSVAIFSIMVTGMMFFQPIKAIMGINKVFERLESEDEKVDLTLQKITFCILNLFVVGMGVYKCASMGLLPTSTSDWLAFEASPEVKIHF